MMKHTISGASTGQLGRVWVKLPCFFGEWQTCSELLPAQEELGCLCVLLGLAGFRFRGVSGKDEHKFDLSYSLEGCRRPGFWQMEGEAALTVLAV